MTSPIAGGGRTFTLLPGQPIMLTEYAAGPNAPLTVINTSDDTIYVADSSSVGIGTGVPVAAGTSIPWTQPGQIWAVLDPAATDTAAVVITGAIAAWSPSPTAIAAAVAAELLAQGIPTVSREVTLFNANVAAGGSTGLIDISTYASIVLEALGQQPLLITQTDNSGNLVDDEYAGGVAPAVFPMRMALSGTKVQIFNQGATSVTLRVLGSSRPAVARLDARLGASLGDAWSFPNTTLTNGQPFLLTQALGGGVQLQGLVYASFWVSAAAKGRFELTPPNGGVGGTPTIIADTSTFVVDAHTNEALADKLMALPAAPYSVYFRSAAAQTIAGGVGFIPALI